MKKRLTRLAIGLGVMAWFGLAATAFHMASAQQGGQPTGALITGESESLDTEGLRISRRYFAAGARSAWHAHTHGQLLFVAEGRARTQKRGEAMIELGVGESNYTGPNVEHWHGATPDSHYMQVAVGFGPGIEWLDYVTDEEYAGR